MKEDILLTLSAPIMFGLYLCMQLLLLWLLLLWLSKLYGARANITLVSVFTLRRFQPGRGLKLGSRLSGAVRGYDAEENSDRTVCLSVGWAV